MIREIRAARSGSEGERSEDEVEYQISFGKLKEYMVGDTLTATDVAYLRACATAANRLRRTAPEGDPDTEDEMYLNEAGQPSKPFSLDPKHLQRWPPRADPDRADREVVDCICSTMQGGKAHVDCPIHGPEEHERPAEDDRAEVLAELDRRIEEHRDRHPEGTEDPVEVRLRAILRRAERHPTSPEPSERIPPQVENDEVSRKARAKVARNHMRPAEPSEEPGGEPSEWRDGGYDRYHVDDEWTLDIEDADGNLVLSIPTGHFSEKVARAASRPKAIQQRILNAVNRRAPATPSGLEERRDGVARIARERRRQVEEEGWDEDHDDQHHGGELTAAAACYALAPRVPYVESRRVGVTCFQDAWPWTSGWDKREKHDRLRRLEIAGALIAAEIDRICRDTEPEEGE
jgi:hypothetical protein